MTTTKGKEKMAIKKKPVLVTTEFRGVFFGYISDDKKLPAEITLSGARNCIYWHSSIGGFLGLASNGPNSQCRIGKRVDEVTLYKITSITSIEPTAEKAWENA